MNSIEEPTRYFARLTEQVGIFEYIVKINDIGCFVTDEVNDWEKDEDYKDEALSNTHMYVELSYDEAKECLIIWNREI
ncbi:MAG: hypothetical protein EOM67_09610 [Spirochaetia bacterium]|nr:hypothetical protein [Spirochaetia bacterium]